MIIRWLIRRDLPEVLAIERESFEFPWTEDEFLSFMRQRNQIGMVAEADHKIVGFKLYSLYTGHLVVETMAVASRARGQGVGRALVAKLADKLSQQRRTHLTARVREANLDAQLFLRATGWQAVGVDREPYDDTTEDAYRFEYWLEWPKPLDDMEDKYIEDAADSAQGDMR